MDEHPLDSTTETTAARPAREVQRDGYPNMSDGECVVAAVIHMGRDVDDWTPDAAGRPPREFVRDLIQALGWPRTYHNYQAVGDILVEMREPKPMPDWDDGECHCPAGAMTDDERDLFGEPPPCPACIDDDPEHLVVLGLTRAEAVAEFAAYMEEVPWAW